MGVRFDELELTLDPPVQELLSPIRQATRLPGANEMIPAPRYRRICTFLIDLSLLAALGLALTPLVTDQGGVGQTMKEEWAPVLSLVGFLLIFSYHYYVGSWLLWGKTIGGAIFDVKVVDAEGLPISFPNATRRWATALVSFLLAGLGFMLAGLPHRRSLPDILSGSQCIADRG